MEYSIYIAFDYSLRRRLKDGGALLFPAIFREAGLVGTIQGFGSNGRFIPRVGPSFPLPQRENRNQHGGELSDRGWSFFPFFRAAQAKKKGKQRNEV